MISCAVVVLDDISEYDKKLDSYTCSQVFLYYLAVNFCVGLPLTVWPMFVSFAPIAKGWWVGANCIQGGVNKEFGVQILSAVICFPHLFATKKRPHTLHRSSTFFACISILKYCDYSYKLLPYSGVKKIVGHLRAICIYSPMCVDHYITRLQISTGRLVRKDRSSISLVPRPTSTV